MITRDEILAAFPGMTPATRDDGAIATALSVGRIRQQSRLVTERGILAALPVPDGDQFLSALESFAAIEPAAGHPLLPYYGTIRRAIGWLKTDGIDVADPLTRSLLDALAAAGVVTSASAAAVKAMADVADPVSPQDVSRALEGWPV